MVLVIVLFANATAKLAPWLRRCVRSWDIRSHNWDGTSAQVPANLSVARARVLLMEIPCSAT